jgi:hypothetical protein
VYVHTETEIYWKREVTSPYIPEASHYRLQSVLFVLRPMSMLVLWAVTLLDLYVDTDVSEEHTASIFRTESVILSKSTTNMKPSVRISEQRVTLLVTGVSPAAVYTMNNHNQCILHIL